MYSQKPILFYPLGGESINKIKELREMAGVTQEELAKVIGVSQSAISQIERGATEPLKITVRAIANYFGVSEDYLNGGENFVSGTN